ncbi:MAG: hypothetical protein Q7R96_01540 [Nanoarchaeota archaeon]|nr:hypothetical protein [Nanoarchaeota archaeon]
MEKAAKIKEEVLAVLYEQNPKALFTKDVAAAIIRDEEFTKRLLDELKKAGFVREVSLSEKGVAYRARRRWQLSEAAFKAYQKLV